MVEHQKTISENGKDAPQNTHIPTNVLHSVEWAFFSTNVIIAPMVTLLYYGLLSSDEDLLLGTTAHGINTVTTLIDLFAGNHPVHILHLVYPFAYASIYIIFSVIYWAAGGTDLDGNPYIYGILDWNKPGVAVVYVAVSVFIGAPIVQLAVFGLWGLRLKIAQCYRGSAVMVFNTPLDAGATPDESSPISKSDVDEEAV